jgi:tight adherence protein B
MIARLRARARFRLLIPPRRRTLDRLLERTRYGRGLAARLTAADSHRSPAGFVRYSTGCCLAGAALAMLWMGVPAALGGAAAGGIAPELMIRRRIAQRSVRITEQLPDVLAGLAAPLRAGASLPQAFAAAAEEAEAPLRSVLDRTCRDFDAGVAQDVAIERFASRCGVPPAVLAARALRVGRQAGAELARVIDEVGETLRASTAQARVSAIVVAALPVVFLLLMSAGARDQASLLFGEPIGWLLLAVGGGLEGAGILWIRKLTRPEETS